MVSDVGQHLAQPGLGGNTGELGGAGEQVVGPADGDTAGAPKYLASALFFMLVLFFVNRERVVFDKNNGASFEEVGTYYEDMATRCWEASAGPHLHCGYWASDALDADSRAGPLRMTEWLIARTSIGKDQKFIDFGSGFGAPAILLAQQKGCLVDGVNASAYQTGKAVAAAAAAGLADRVRFRVEDARTLSAPDASYDGGWFIESIFHMGHARVLTEARRVLKPGATLLITDFTGHERTTAEFTTLKNETLLAELGSTAAYPGMLAAAGFELVQMVDLSVESIQRGAAHNRLSLERNKEAMLAIADAEYLGFVAEVSELFAQNVGYVFIEARAV